MTILEIDLSSTIFVPIYAFHIGKLLMDSVKSLEKIFLILIHIEQTIKITVKRSGQTVSSLDITQIKTYLEV